MGQAIGQGKCRPRLEGECGGMDTRSLIYRKAVRVFAEKGYDATSVQEIAEATGVAKGTIYYHFKGKRELFVASIKEGLRELIDEAKAAVGRIGDPVEQIGYIFDAFIERQMKSSDFVYLLFKEALAPGREWLEEISEYWHQLATLIARVVSEGQDAGVIQDVEPDTITRYILGSMATAAMPSGVGLSWNPGMARELKFIMLRGITAADRPDQSGRKTEPSP